MRSIKSYFHLALGQMTPFSHTLLVGGLRLCLGILGVSLFMFWANGRFFENLYTIRETAFALSKSAVSVMIEVFIVSLTADYLEKEHQAS